MRDFMAAGQHDLSPDFAALIRATVTRPPTILILPVKRGRGTMRNMVEGGAAAEAKRPRIAIQ
jgi:hypothetical protein